MQPPSRITNGTDLPDYIITEIKNVAVEAGQYRIDISSNQRTVIKHVEIMLDYYITCVKTSDKPLSQVKDATFHLAFIRK